MNHGSRRGWGTRGAKLVGIALAAALALPALALAHVERVSYFPDPAPEQIPGPDAGGEVPEWRHLYTALDSAPAGETRIVCQRGSRSRLETSIGRARAQGIKWRPSQSSAQSFSRAQARALRAFNKRLKRHCEYDSIQAAVNDSGNNDRIVIMPGIYTEPDSRAAPTNDPACDQYEVENDQGATGSVGYSYHANCPNDANLIFVQGRAEHPDGDPPPPPASQSRNGIPNLGECVRCNLQIEGSGVKANDVVIDAGNVDSGTGGPAEPVKDVVIKADRADGFYLRKVSLRHAREHGAYVHETDGYVMDKMKFVYNEEYGTLTFTSDHGLTKQCDAFGSGDAGLYPGAAPDTGEEADAGFYPDAPRFNQEIRKCDMRHNLLGYSGSMGNAVHINHSDFYDNAVGFSTDTISAGGHPGYPQDSDLLEDNEFYSNNFNPFEPGSDIEPRVPAAVGTGMWIAGGNANEIRNNRFWNNWRRGAMLFAIPDALACTPEQTTCEPEGLASTSNRNKFHDNVMGIARDGSPDPNGTDFWWDSFPGNQNNCWFDNGTVTSDPPAPLLPSNCQTSVGTGNLLAELELVGCLAAFAQSEFDPDDPLCPWFETPAEPGSQQAAAQQRAQREQVQRMLDSGKLDEFCKLLDEKTCEAFRNAN